MTMNDVPMVGPEPCWIRAVQHNGMHQMDRRHTTLSRSQGDHDPLAPQ